MAAEYTVIDQATDLIYGPYDTFAKAVSAAEEFDAYEIFHGVALVDWRKPHKSRTDAEQIKAAFRRAHRDAAWRALFVTKAREILAQ